jgi:ABC-2 type transport system permease protein
VSSVSEDRRPSFARVTAVEVRKAVDTRSGFWVPIAVALLTVLVAVLESALQQGENGTFLQVIHSCATPGYLLLPVMGVLLICGEWTQRTTLSTFTLVPQRGRVIAAKVAAGVIISTVGLLLVLVCTLVCASLFGKAVGGTGSLPWQVIGQTWVYLVAAMVMGLAFGAAILLSAPAIVAFLLLPIVWDAILSIRGLNGIGNWLDSSNTLEPLSQYALSATEWAHVGTTLAAFIGIPLAIGAFRLSRGDID